MENQIRATIPEHLCDLLYDAKTGEVLLVTSSGIYLQFGRQILLLCDDGWGILPIGIGVQNFSHAVSCLRPQQGQLVTAGEDSLIFPSGIVRLTAKQPQRGAATDCLPQLPDIRQAAEELAALGKERGFSMLVKPLVLGCSVDDAVQKNPYCALAHTQLGRLVAAFGNRDGKKLCRCVEKLLGLGQGLTPSADDILLGMLYLFRALPAQRPELAELFQETIGQHCDQRTNQISAAYLKAVIAGAPFERMESVYRGLCGQETLDIAQLTQIGSSSGSEMLLGMLIGLRLCGYDITQKENT